MVMDGYDEMMVWLFYKRNERGSTEIVLTSKSKSLDKKLKRANRKIHLMPACD